MKQLSQGPDIPVNVGSAKKVSTLRALELSSTSSFGPTHEERCRLLFLNGQPIELLRVVHDEMVLSVRVHDEYDVVLAGSVRQQAQHGHAAFGREALLVQDATCVKQSEANVEALISIFFLT